MVTAPQLPTPPLAAYLADERMSLSQFAAQLGTTKATIHRWIKKGVPAERAPEIERATGGKITRAQLRPDLWVAAADGGG